MYKLTSLSTRSLHLLALTAGTLALLAAAGCSPVGYFSESDRVGYYKEHPRTNSVVMATRSHVMIFEPGKSQADSLRRDAFSVFLGDTSSAAVDEIVIELPRGDVLAEARRKFIEQLLAQSGLGSIKPIIRQNSDLNAGQTMVLITHAQAVAPNCPDWSMSGSNNYSNAWHTNVRCAGVTNLGRMVADPRDLVRGTGRASPDAERSALIVQQYHQNISSGEGGGGGSSGESAGGDASGSEGN